MPVQDVTLTDAVQSSRPSPAPRPTADAVRWAATLLAQLGLDSPVAIRQAK